MTMSCSTRNGIEPPAGTFDTFRVECVGKWISRAVLDAIYRGRVKVSQSIAVVLLAMVLADPVLRCSYGTLFEFPSGQ